MFVFSVGSHSVYSLSLFENHSAGLVALAH